MGRIVNRRWRRLWVLVCIFSSYFDLEMRFTNVFFVVIEVPVLLGLVYVVRWIGERRGWKD